MFRVDWDKNGSAALEWVPTRSSAPANSAVEATISAAGLIRLASAGRRRIGATLRAGTHLRAFQYGSGTGIAGLRRAKLEEPDHVTEHQPARDRGEPGTFDIGFGADVVAGCEYPVRCLLKGAHQKAHHRAFRQRVVQKTDGAAGPANTPELAKSGKLLLVFEHAKHEGAHDRIEAALGEIGAEDVHGPQLNLPRESGRSSARLLEHPGAGIDAGHLRI